MDFKNIDEQVIQKYQQDEQLMIRLFVQWCANNEVGSPRVIQTCISKATRKCHHEENHRRSRSEDDIDIDNETMLDVLQLFGNEDLAFIVADEIERLSKKHK